MSIPVELQSVDVELGGQQILTDVSLRVAPGEFVTLLGPSGSGKTTTLNVVAGFVRQRDGHVRLGDDLVDDVPVHRREIGIVFQNYALFPHLNVGENVAYPLKTRRVGKAERTEGVAKVLELVQLEGLERRKVSSLSGGQQQRVALARALVFEPRVLLLDEPLAALDRQLREAMQVELKRIQREIGVTTIGVTHDQVEAMTMSDRIAIMRDGLVEQVGESQGLYQRPATLFVAEFLGEANLLPVDARGQVEGFDLRLDHDRPGTAVVRPEALTLCGADAPECRARAMLESANYQGTRYQVSARLSSGRKLVVSQPVDGTPPQVGSEVGIGWEGGRLHVIEDALEGAPVAGQAEAPETAPGAAVPGADRLAG